METQQQYIDRRITYQENVINLLEQLKQALQARNFDQAQIIEADLKVINLEEEIHFKKENLKVYKERLNT